MLNQVFWFCKTESDCSDGQYSLPAVLDAGFVIIFRNGGPFDAIFDAKPNFFCFSANA